MLNCFFCKADCTQAGIDGMWGDCCKADVEWVNTYYPSTEEDEEEESEVGGNEPGR